MRSPHAKLERLPWSARPIAIPAAHSAAIREVVSNPRRDATEIRSSILRKIDKNESINFLTDESRTYFSKGLRIILTRCTIIHRHTISQIIAHARLAQYSITNGAISA